MAKFLHGQTLARAIHRLIEEESNVRCAVAFWGPTLANAAKRRNAKVVLDIAMRGTSRNALRMLGVPEHASEPRNENVKVLDWLHSKLYLSSDHAIIGSANASRNALGNKIRPPALFEAGVLIEREADSQAYAAASRLFRTYWEAGHVATAEDFDRAAKVSTMAAARDGAPVEASGFSLLNEVLSDPARFANTAFIFGDAKIDKDDKNEADTAYAENAEDDHGPSRRQLICATNDSDYDLQLQEAVYVLMYWFGRGSGLHGYFDIVRISYGDGMVAFYGRRQWSVVRSRLGISGTVTVKGYWENDGARAEAIASADNHVVGDRFRIVAADTLCEMLESDWIGV